MEKLQKLPEYSTGFAFVPKPLIVEGRPELSVFSLNILFMSVANIDGVDTMGRSLYEPDLDLYFANKGQAFLRYFNQYGKQDYIDLRYSASNGQREADKYIAGQLIGKAIGSDWKEFFIQLTAPGLSTGEACLFQPLKRD